MALAAGTIALWFDTTQCSSETADATGNHDLTEVGSVTYDGTNTPPIGTSSAHNFVASTNYYTSSTISDVLFATKNSWTMQLYLYQTAQSNTGVFLSWNPFIAAHTGDEIYLDDSGFSALTTAGVNMTTGSWIHVAITYDGTNFKVYKDNTLIQTAARTAMNDPAGAISKIGVYFTNAFPVLGQMNQFRIMNTVETTFPTVDVAAPVTSFAAGTPTKTSVPFTWVDSVATSSFVRLYYNTVDTFSTATLAGVSVTGQQTGAIGGLTEGTLYYFWAIPVTAAGVEFDVSASITATTVSATAIVPTSLAVGTPTSTTIPVTFTDAVTASYVHFYYNTTDTSVGATEANWVSDGIGSATITGLTPSTTYYIFAKTINPTGDESVFTTSVSGTTTASGSALPPTSLALQSLGRTTAKLTWVDDPANSFVDMYYNTVDTFSSSTFGGAVSQGEQIGEITGLIAGTTYYFWVAGRHADMSVSTEVGSVTGATVGNAGIAGTNVVEQIRNGMNTRLAAVLGSDYKKLAYIREIEKNSNTSKTLGYGVSVGGAEPSDESINRSHTYRQEFTVVLCSGGGRKKTERDQEAAALTMATAMDSIIKDFTQYRLGLPTLVIQVENATIQEREILEDGDTVVLRATFPIIYRQAFR